MKEGLSRYPLLAPLAALCLGVAQGFVCPSDWGRGALIFFLIWGALFFCRRLLPKGAWLVCLLLFFLAWARARELSHPPLPELLQQWMKNKQEKSVLLKAQTFCQGQGERSYFDGELLGFYQEESFHPLSARVRWYVNAPQCGVRPGGIYRTRGGFRAPRRYQNPSSFDYPAYLTVQGLVATAHIDSPEKLVLLQGEDSPIFTLRQKGMSLIEAADLTPIQREAMLGLFWGVRPTESSGLFPIFRDTGLAHLLVVSGFHFTLIFGIFFFLFRAVGYFFSAWGERGWVRNGAMALALLPAVIFSYWVGLGPPVLRALASVFLVVMIYWIDGIRDYLSLALLAAFLMLLWWPLWLFDPSFLFSFGAVFTLILFSRRFVPFIHFLQERWPRPLARGVGLILSLPLATSAVNGVLYPLMAHYFHRISFVAPLANALSEPFFSLLLLPGILAANFLGTVWRHGALGLIEYLGMGMAWVLRGLEAMAAWNFSAAWVGPPRAWVWLFWSLDFGFFLWARRWPLFLLGLVLLGSLGLVDRLVSGEAASGLLKFTVLDVGQGDSILLQLPDASAVLIDGGGIPYGDFDMGEKVVLPELLRRGIREIRAMVLTHPDGDHALGLISLARDLKVREFWTAAPWRSLAEVPELEKVLREKKIPIRTLGSGDWLFAAGSSFQVLWPPLSAQSIPADLSRNDRSLVLRVCLDQVCFLSTGDLENRGEQLLLAQGEDIQSRVLKVGHHGSRTSSTPEFLHAVHPQFALISAGKENRFGMPHPEVLQRLDAKGVRWFSTERDGQLEMETDGKKLFIEEPVPGSEQGSPPAEKFQWADGPIPNY